MPVWSRPRCTSLRLPLARRSLVANVCRQSWMRKSGRPARSRRVPVHAAQRVGVDRPALAFVGPVLHLVGGNVLAVGRLGHLLRDDLAAHVASGSGRGRPAPCACVSCARTRPAFRSTRNFDNITQSLRRRPEIRYISMIGWSCGGGLPVPPFLCQPEFANSLGRLFVSLAPLKSSRSIGSFQVVFA